MATHTSTSESSPKLQPFLTLPEARRHVGLQAAWEVDAMTKALREACGVLGDDELNDVSQRVLLHLKIRGMTARLLQLGSVLMSVLDDDDETVNLGRKVYGDAFEIVPEDPFTVETKLPQSACRRRQVGRAGHV